MLLRTLVLVLIGLMGVASPAFSQTDARTPMGAPVVFLDIAGPDLPGQRDFYRTVFGWDIDQSGAFTVQVASPLQGTLRGDPADTMVYVGVDDVTATLQLIERSGGTVLAPRFEVPGVVILGLFRDPAGNSMGLVEMEGGRPRIP